MSQVMDPPSQVPVRANRVEAIDGSIDRAAVGRMAASTSIGGVQFGNMEEVMNFAKLMAVSDVAVPKHLRGNPGACLAVAVQGWEWAINPFAIANKTYVVNDRLGYESALYQAVLTRRAPIKGRLKVEYAGEGQSRTCRVSAELKDGSGDVEYVSPKFGNIKPKNSPLWVNDPDQQLYYFSVRSFARRHFADVMMGIATVDELYDVEQQALAAAADQQKSRTVAVLEKITASRPPSEGQVIEPDADAAANIAAQDAYTAGPEQSDAGSDLDALTTHTDPEPPPAANYAASWESTRGRLEQVAQDRNIEPSALDKTIAGYLLAKGCKGKPEKLTAEQRQELLDLVDAN